MLSSERNIPWGTIADWQGGALVVFFRCLFELRWLFLVIFSGLTITAATRKNADAAHCRMDTAAVCAGAEVCAERLMCTAEKELALKDTGGLRLTDHVEQFVLECTALIILMNVSAMVVAVVQCTYDTKFLAFWRSEAGGNSDICLCHQINKKYAEKSFQYIRYSNIFLILVAIAYGMVIAFRRGTFLDTFSWSDPTFISRFALLYAAYKLWLPETRLAKLPFHIYADTCLVEGNWFTVTDLLSSAPVLLLEKLTVHANDNAVAKMKEELEEEKELHA